MEQSEKTMRRGFLVTVILTIAVSAAISTFIGGYIVGHHKQWFQGAKGVPLTSINLTGTVKEFHNISPYTANVSVAEESDGILLRGEQAPGSYNYQSLNVPDGNSSAMVIANSITGDHWSDAVLIPSTGISPFTLPLTLHKVSDVLSGAMANPCFVITITFSKVPAHGTIYKVHILNADNNADAVAVQSYTDATPTTGLVFTLPSAPVNYSINVGKMNTAVPPTEDAVPPVVPFNLTNFGVVYMPGNPNPQIGGTIRYTHKIG